MSYSFKEKNKLKNWAEYHTLTRGDLNETRSCLISRNDLESLWNHVKSNDKIDGIRIYLIRRDDIIGIKKLYDGRPQLSFAIVPTTGFVKGWGAKDFFNNDDKIACIIPGDSNESSGLCPNNCGEPVDGL